MTFYLFEYNNYYNRIVKRLISVEDYEHDGKLLYSLPNTNFIPNDGISTEHIINYETASGNYVIITDTYNEIISRWFVIEAVRVRAGQYKLSLYRDVIADWYDEILTAPSFIKKGYIQTVNDPAIFNNEQMSFNQIKMSETKIKDKSGAAWYVGYVAKSAGGESISIPTSDYELSGEYSSLDQYPYATFTSPDTPFICDYTDLTFKLKYVNSMAQGWDEHGRPKLPTFDRQGVLYNSYGVISATTSTGFPISAQGDSITTVLPYVSQAVQQAGVNWKEDSYTYTGAHRDSAIQALRNHEGDYIKVGNVIYQVALTETTITQQVVLAASSVSSQPYLNVAKAANTLAGKEYIRVNSPSGSYAGIEFTANAYVVSLIPQEVEAINFTLPADRTHCKDSAYDLIAVPATFLWIDDQAYSTDTSLSRKVVDNLILTLGSKSYDWQLVPYAPVLDKVFDSMTGGDGKLVTSRLEESDYSLIENDYGIGTVVLYPSESQFTKVIRSYTIPVSSNVKEFKIANECDVYRLCSPNYNGQFEFSAAKNNGVDGWNISYTYKPFTPYIRVAPNFSGLYGRNFFDSRGLVCGGDFSISQTSDAWVQYEINNKNYLNIFDRQIENMEVNNSVQRIAEGVNLVTGAVQGAVGGGALSSMLGAGMGVGAGVGAGVSIAGGIADMMLNEKLRQEALDYTKDQFGYKMQNIKALPYSLAKVGAQNSDFKKWPFVEYYTCTATEKQALADKLDWNGFSIGRIGNIKDFINPNSTTGTFIQAKPIRLDTLTEDSHIADVIATELQTGVYI